VHNLSQDPIGTLLLATALLSLVVALWFWFLWIRLDSTGKRQGQGGGYLSKFRQTFSALSPRNTVKGAYCCLKLILSAAKDTAPMRGFARSCIHVTNGVYSVILLSIASIKTMMSSGMSVPEKLIDSSSNDTGQASDVFGEFDPKYDHNHLKCPIHCNSGQRQTEKKIHDQPIMEPVKEEPPSCDAPTCPSSSMKLKDKALKELTDTFLEDVDAYIYNSSLRVQANSTTDPDNCKTKWTEAPENRLTSVDLLYTERRRHVRKPCFIAADFAIQDRVFRDFIRNISRGGLFIEIKQPMRNEAETTVVFSLPSQAERFKLAGHVAWTSWRGIGIKFDTSEYLEAMMRLV
jgi:hypothetical protein